MKRSICLIALIPAFLNAQGLNLSGVGPLEMAKRPLEDRTIEPTSPILGKDLTALIRADQRTPKEIVDDLLNQNHGLERELQISSIAYFKTLESPLQDYCKGVKTPMNQEKDLKQVEHAAIPVAVLKYVHSDYVGNLNSLIQEYQSKNDLELRRDALKAALSYQQLRYDCLPVKKLEGMEKKAMRFFPRHFDNLVRLNHKISSPEAPFPRIQFAINGLTQFVFAELLQMPYDKLSSMLEVIYKAELEWMELRKENKTKERFISYVERIGLEAGYLPREILLVLSYSTRNMPSIDVHYGYDTRKALLLEVYFWKFSDIKNAANKNYLPDLFPNKIMKRNPGFYHYATAALLACEIRLHGFSGATAHFMAIVSKAGYKFQKMMDEAIDQRVGPRGMLKIAKQQGMQAGIDAGRYGGGHGTKFCRVNTPKDKRFTMKEFEISNEASIEELNKELQGEEFISDSEVDL